MEEKVKTDEEVVKRLNILISLILEQPNAESVTSMTKKINRLVALGVSPSDVAKILNKQLNYVTAVLSQRKPKKKEGKYNG